MLIPPNYTLTARISELLSQIEICKQVIDAVTIPPEVELNIRRKSTLKSSLYSANIEGNPLVFDEIAKLSPKDKRKIEVYNLLKAINLIHEKDAVALTKTTILTLHKIAMKSLLDESYLGKIRTNMEAIFNSAGGVVYMPPPPSQVEALLNQLISYINGTSERFVPIKAVLAHYSFEKIHPFLDGSGRVGRLLIRQVLKNGGYNMKGILPLEEYLENHRTMYYQMLEEPENNATEYVEFMLEALAESAEKAKEMVLDQKKIEPEDLLLPRRAEIFRIIKDHGLMNFDTIRRRFLAINARTLRYDLKKLQDGGLIHKLGTTKGVFYKSASSTTTAPSAIIE